MTLSFLGARPKSVWLFFAQAVGCFLLTTVVWMPLSVWTSYPSAVLSQWVLAHAASDWVRSVHQEPGLLVVDTRIVVAGFPSHQGVAELVAEAETAHFAYGLPLFVALLMASRSRPFVKKTMLGYLVLLIPQTFSLVFDILRQIMVAGGRPGALAVDQWQMEGVAMGYQMGVLLLPTLAPVLVWLWFERGFVSEIFIERLAK